MKLTHVILTALLLTPLSALHAADAPAKVEKPKAAKPAPEFRKYELPVEPDENDAYGPHRMQLRR